MIFIKKNNLGTVIKIYEFMRFSAEPIFKDFILNIYAKRLIAKKEGRSDLVYFYKLLMNSLYGKFGQRKFS